MATYHDLITSAGYSVIFYKFFGDYQGELACVADRHLEKRNYSTYLILGSFGSCSGCDYIEDLESKGEIPTMAGWEPKILEIPIGVNKDQLVEMVHKFVPTSYNEDMASEIIRFLKN